MGVYSGPDVSESGLVLALDGANLKSFKGEPTTNLITNGDFSSGLSGWSDYVGTTKTILSSRSLPFSQDIGKSYLNCKSQSTLGPGGNYGGIITYVSTTTGVTYTISYWARSLSGSLGLKFSFQTGSGDENNLSHSQILTSEWVKYSHTATLNIAKGTLFIWNSNISNGIFEITNIQLEAKSSPTTFVNGARGSTVATGGGWADMSGNGNHGQLVNGVRESSDNLGVLVFDGVDDRVQVGNNNGFGEINSTPTISLEMWAKISRKSGGGLQYQQLVGFRNDVGFDFFFLLLDASGISVNTEARIRTLSGAYDIGVPYTSYFDKWTYIAYIANVNRTDLYINGSLVGSNTSVTGSFGSTSGNFMIGSSPVGQYPAKGNISNVRVYNRALASSEIQQNFNATRGRYGV